MSNIVVIFVNNKSTKCQNYIFFAFLKTTEWFWGYLTLKFVLLIKILNMENISFIFVNNKLIKWQNYIFLFSLKLFQWIFIIVKTIDNSFRGYLILKFVLLMKFLIFEVVW